MSAVEQLEALGEVLSPAVRAVIRAQEAEVTALRTRLAELEARLGMNSTNSSRPPSSDPPGTPRPARPKSGRRRGGQKGHPGHHRSLVPPTRVDPLLEHRPQVCRRCTGSLAAGREVGRAEVHQVIELPPVRAVVTEHRALAIACPHCGAKNRAPLPREVAASGFGPRLRALVVLLSARFRLSRRAVTQLLGDVLDVPPPALGTAQRLCQEAGAALHGPWREALFEVRRSRVVSADETPWKLRGKGRWLWVGVARHATAFRIARSRAARERERLLGRAHPGILTTDRWRGYDGHPLERRQLCWAHLRRNLQALCERGPPEAELGRWGVAEAERLLRLHRQWRAGEISRAAMQQGVALVRARFGRWLQRAARSGARKAGALAQDLERLWPALWLFATAPDVEPTNNAAERAVRHPVLWRRTSFGSASGKGLRFAERVLTVVATCRQQERNLLDYLTQAIVAHRSEQPIPRLIPIG